MSPLFHLAIEDDWEAACAVGEYRISTRGLTLEQIGFIHLSFEHQWQATRHRFYADVTGDLVLLEVDANGLDIRVEVGNPETGERFPHLYGALPMECVIAQRRLLAPHAS